MLKVWETPESLRTFFGDLAEKYPAEPRWRDGAEIAQRWIYLMERQAYIRPEEVSALLEMVACGTRSGSAWNDLAHHIFAWVRTLPPLLQAPALCAYFSNLAARQPASEVALRGWETAAEWLRLVQIGPAPAGEARALLSAASPYICTSDAWFYLGQMIEAWTHQQFTVVYS